MNKDLIGVFLHEVNLRIKNILLAIENNALDTIKREIHTLKGTSRMMGYYELGENIHIIEDKLQKYGLNNSNIQLLRRFVEVLPQSIVNNDNQILNNIISNHEYNTKKYEIKNTIIPIDINSVYNAINILTQTYDTTDIKKIRNLISNSLREFYNLLTIPLSEIFKSINKEVFEISKKYKKKVRLELDNNNVKVDRQLAQDIIVIIIALIRNAISHGIEMPEERLKKGKSEYGTIRIKISKTDDNICIEIMDDGMGIYNKKLNTISEEKNISIETLIFENGVSSKEDVDSISGRGEGLAGIKSLIRSKNGDINVISQKDQFTKFIINLPYNMITNYYYIFTIKHNYIAFKYNDIISISQFHSDIHFDNIFNLQEGLFVHLSSGQTILVSEFINKVERAKNKLPENLLNTPYTGWFTYSGKPCLVINIKKIQKVGVYENIKVS